MAYLTERKFNDLLFLPKPLLSNVSSSLSSLPPPPPQQQLSQQRVRKKRRKTGGGIVNTVIDSLPFEMHVPGYEYLGPGTKLQEKLRKGVKPINKLDEAALEHDKVYYNTGDTKERAKADKVLENSAWQRVLASDSGLGEKTSAWLTTNAMKLKGLFGEGLARSEGGVIHRQGQCKRPATTTTTTMAYQI
jgi:hypothetical protein